MKKRAAKKKTPKAELRGTKSDTAAKNEIRRLARAFVSTNARVIQAAVRAQGDSIAQLIRSHERLQRDIPRLMEARRTFVGWQATIPANSSHTFEMQPQSMVFVPDRLLIIPSSAGLVIDSIRVGDDELVIGGAPVELFGVDHELPTEAQRKAFGPGDALKFRNTTAAPIQVNVALKGRFESDSERTTRLEQTIARLRAAALVADTRFERLIQAAAAYRADGLSGAPRETSGKVLDEALALARIMSGHGVLTSAVSSEADRTASESHPRNAAPP